MACNCETYECLEVVQTFEDCAEEITLKLPAEATGNYTFQYEFNERWKGGIIEVVDGENITLPWVFNEHYKHIIKIYDQNGDLLNDTCYTLDTSKIAGSFTTPAEISGDDVIFNVTVEEDGSSFTSPLINGRPVMVVFDGSQSYNRQPDNFTQSNGSNTVNMTNGVSFYAGQILTITVQH